MIIPDKLQLGDEVRVIAPARSMALISDEAKIIANKRLSDLGFKVTFGKHIEEMDDFASSSIESRIKDLHDAFADKNVKGILTVIGGYNSNQLLNSIDWDLIKDNPKIFCGYSDITILQNAIYKKTGLVIYSGPHYSSFGQKIYFDYTLDYFKKACMDKDDYEILPSSEWSDDIWYMDQEKRSLIKNDGLWVVNNGQAEGKILGGNLGTLSLLFGTEFMPDLSNSILFLEDDAYTKGADVVEFDRHFQSLVQQPNFNKIKGIVIGRFQVASKMTNDLLIKIVKTKKELNDIPVVANMDFGHTSPIITFPIGGEAVMNAGENSSISITKH